MAIENPIESHVTGPAQTIDEKAEALLATINLYILRNNPNYCKKTLETVEWFYSKNHKEMSYGIKTRIKKIKEMLIG
ncbi:MAG: hypothetical protein ACPLXC_00660 [Candidatus Pacearchaeota archaeon]